MPEQARVVYTGLVQGVYFRANCQRKAEDLGLVGWVRNLPDGSVEALFQGAKAAIQECIAWNRSEQPQARVESVEIRWEAGGEAFPDFSIRR